MAARGRKGFRGSNRRREEKQHGRDAGSGTGKPMQGGSLKSTLLVSAQPPPVLGGAQQRHGPSPWQGSKEHPSHQPGCSHLPPAAPRRGAAEPRGYGLPFFFFFFSFFPPDSSCFPCSAGPAAPRWDGERGEHQDAAPDLHQGFAVRAERPCKAAPKRAPVSQHTARPTPAEQEENPRALKHHPSVLPSPSGHQRPHWHPQPDHGTQETSRSPAAATRAPLTEVPRGHRGQGARCQQ